MSKLPWTHGIKVIQLRGDIGSGELSMGIFADDLYSRTGAHCTPVLTAPLQYPVVLGDIEAGKSASAAFTVRVTGCDALARDGNMTGATF